MPMAIRELADTFLRKPKYVTVTPVSSTAENVEQKIYYVNKEDKRKLLYHIIRNDGIANVLVFVRTKHGADNAVKALRKNGITAEAIHGDKSQNTRQRVLESFKNQEISVLVATDIAARGIDIDNLPYVLNLDLPNIPETYVHRIGRTGRAGNSGVAISFCSADELPYWKDISRLIKVNVKEMKDHPFGFSVEAEVKEDAKPDLRNKNKESNNSRKSAASKKNKKRWY
jgi:ATP-dependent RNA helicase RhlE